MTQENKKEWENKVGEVWRKVKHELEIHGVIFPNNFNGIGGAYGAYVAIGESLTQTAEEARRERNKEIAEAVEGLKKKEHSTLPPPTENWKIGYNQALSDLLSSLKEK